MQYLQISDKMKLSELSTLVGDRNVEYILSANSLSRTPNIGAAFNTYCNETIDSAEDVSWQRKSIILNTMTQDSDVFETAALLGSSAWKLLNAAGTFPSMLKIPETLKLPDSSSILGNGIGISSTVYEKSMAMLKVSPHTIDPGIFNEYSTIRNAKILNYERSSVDMSQWFKLPWGQITLYSSLGQDSVEFPVFPEELSDGVKANYTTMPDTIFQYEPWQLYDSSGPRSNQYTFTMHRDMWTGDHRDGKCNQLIRFCQANCYPEFNGATVHTALVTLYISGYALITGVITDVSVDWDGPIGQDGWYLGCKLTLNITEVSQQALNYSVVRNKSLIG